MKKNILTIAAVTLLASCSSYQNGLRETSLKILSPTGAPAVSAFNFANGLTTVLDPQTGLIPEFGKGNYDVIIAPTKAGLTQIINKHVNYKLAATVTFGNFSLVATGNDDDGVLNDGDTVLYFQPNDIPGLVFNYLYGDLNLKTYFVDAANKTAQSLNTGTFKVSETETVKLDYVYSAEPIITNLNKGDKVVEKARDAFKNKANGKSIIQASVFVKTNTDSKLIDEFLELLSEDISHALKDANNFKQSLEQYGSEKEQENLFGFNATTIYNCMKDDNNGLGLGFFKAKEHKEEINYFMNDILNAGLTIDEEVYY